MGMCDSGMGAWEVVVAFDDARIMNGYDDSDAELRLRVGVGAGHGQQYEFRQHNHHAKMAATAVVVAEAAAAARTTTFANVWPATDDDDDVDGGINYSASHSTRVRSNARLRSDINSSDEGDERTYRTHTRIDDDDEDEDGNVLSSGDLISNHQSAHNQEQPHNKKTALSSTLTHGQQRRHQHLFLIALTLLVVLLSSAEQSSAFLLDGSQSSFAQFRKWYSGLNGTLELEFKSDQPNGLVLYTDDGGTYDFFELKLVEGVLRLRYNLGGGAQIITVGRDLHDGHWHKVQVNTSAERVKGWSHTYIHTHCWPLCRRVR